MAKSSDTNPKVWRTRVIFDVGLVGIGLFGFLLYNFVIPGIVGIWLSTILIVVGLLYICLDIAKKWPASWKQRFNQSRSYKHWWVWLVTAGLWFTTFGVSCLNPTNVAWTGATFLVGVMSAHAGIQEVLLLRVVSGPNDVTPNTVTR